MIEQTDLAGSFTLPGTSMTLNRMGYGAMQLAGRRTVLGTAPRCRCSDRCSARGGRVRREPHRYQRLLWSPCHESDHQAGAPSLSRGSRDRHQSRRSARCRQILDSGSLAQELTASRSRQPAKSWPRRARCRQSSRMLESRTRPRDRSRRR